MKKKIVILLLALACALALIACGDSGSGDSDFKFDDYSYTNPQVSDKDWRDLTGDSDMTVDGVLDEAHYTDLNTLDFTTGYDGEVEIKVTAYLGETGMYVGVTVKDDYLYYVSQRAVYNNTSIELHIAPIDTTTLTKNVIQLRYGLNGYTEQWVGVASADGYAYSRIYVPNMARIRLTGEGAGINKRVEGQGFVLETYVPYTSFGLSAKPDSVRMGPAYNHVRNENTENVERLHKDAPGMSYTNPESFAIFDATGYNQGASGALAVEKEIDGNLADWESETDVKANSVLLKDKDDTGKQVEFMAYLGTDGIYFAVDALHGKYVDNNTSWFLNTNFEFFINGGNQRWVTPDRASNTSVTGGMGSMKTVDSGTGDARYHTTVEAFIPYKSIPGYTEGDEYVRVGFAFKTSGDLMAPNHSEYPSGGSGISGKDDWWFALGHTPNNASEQFYVKEGGIFETPKPIEPVVTTLEIDGDLGDWTAATVGANTLSNIMRVKDANNDKGYTVKAFIDDNTLYVAYEAKHQIYKNTENDWFLNTNAEMQILGGHQVYINAKGDKNLPTGAVAEMKTVDNYDENDDSADAVAEDSPVRYTTTMEMAIPLAALEAYGYDPAVGYVRIGFAFKTGGDNIAKGGDYSSGLDNSDWWWANGHSPSAIGEQYFVTENGILTSVDGFLTLDGSMADWQALSNWDQINANKLSVYDTYSQRIDDFGTCGMDVYGYANEHGIFMYYKVRHHINPIDGDKAWHMNPNAEAWVGCAANGDGGTQCFVSARPETLNMVAYFNTREIAANADQNDPKAHYETIVELYIPYWVYGGKTDNVGANAKLAWKINDGTGDGGYDDLTVTSSDVWVPGGTTDSWWCFVRHIGANGLTAAV